MGAPHRHGHVALGASPYFTESPDILFSPKSGGLASPTDTGMWLGGSPLTSRSSQTSLSWQKGGTASPSAKQA